jgi:hypothetical protein
MYGILLQPRLEETIIMLASSMILANSLGFIFFVLTQNLHLAPSTQQAEQAGFTREEITRRASQFP